MSTAVATYERSTLPERAQYAQTLSGAADLIPRGLFDKTTGKPSPAKILLVMETGAMLGLHPMASLQGISVFDGKATISPQLMTGLIRAAGHRITIEKTGSIAEGDYSVTVTGTRSDNGDVFTDTWDIARAVRAGLCKTVLDANTNTFQVRARSKAGEPLPWEKYPELMCVWRAVGVVGREGFDDVLMGISYTPADFEDVTVNESGAEEYVEAEPSEDWTAVIEACTTSDDVKAVVERAKEHGEFNDKVRTLALTKFGMLKRAEPEATDERDVVPSTTHEEETDEAPSSANEDAEPTEEEYERIAAEEFAAAVDSGEVRS